MDVGPGPGQEGEVECGRLLRADKVDNGVDTTRLFENCRRDIGVPAVGDKVRTIFRLGERQPLVVDIDRQDFLEAYALRNREAHQPDATHTDDRGPAGAVWDFLQGRI